MKKSFLLVAMVLSIVCILAGCSDKTVELEKNAVDIPEETNYSVEKPWENGGKAIDKYTWGEFERLNGDQQEAFFEAFESAELFEEWMNRVNPDQTVPVEEVMLIEKPWENGGKTIEEYTWEEFEGLNGDQQEAFFEAFESAESFEEWMNRVNPDETAPAEEVMQPDEPWENGCKAIEKYTWEEFEKLSGVQQEAFFEAFESAEAFEEWMNRVNPDEAALVEEVLLIEKPWENGEKPIGEYTWEEFEGLSGDQQEAFFEAFESVEAFEEWMEKVKP